MELNLNREHTKETAERRIRKLHFHIDVQRGMIEAAKERIREMDSTLTKFYAELDKLRNLQDDKGWS